MNEREAVEAILEEWADGWDLLHPGNVSDPEYCPWTDQNVDFTTEQLGALGAWARISINHTTRAQVTSGAVGSRKFDTRGQVFVQLFAPVGNSLGRLADLAGDVREVLEGKRLGALNLYAGASQPLPDDGTWARSVVVVSFRYTETR